MANIGGFSIKPKKRWKKPVAIAGGIVIFVLAVIYVLGLTVGKGAERRQKISEAVSENVQLRQQIADKDNEIENLQSEIDVLKGQVENIPAPVTAEPQNGAGEETYESNANYPDYEYLSPREGIAENYDDE